MPRKLQPYRLPPLPPAPVRAPGAPDDQWSAQLAAYAALALAHESNRLEIIRIRTAGELARDLAPAPGPEGPIQLSLLAPPDVDAERRDRAAYARCRAAWIAGGAAERAYDRAIAADSRDASIADRGADLDQTRAIRESYSGGAGQQAKSGPGLRNAVGYCYRTDTHASKYRPTTSAPTGDARPADALTRRTERGEYSDAACSRRAAIGLACDPAELAPGERAERPWIVSATVAPGPSGAVHASGVDVTRARKAAARDAIRANARIAKLRARSA